MCSAFGGPFERHTHTGKTRQSIRLFLLNNFEPDIDFWKEGGKLYVSREVATTILTRANLQDMLKAA